MTFDDGGRAPCGARCRHGGRCDVLTGSLPFDGTAEDHSSLLRRIREDDAPT